MQAGSLNRLFRMAVVAGVESAVKIHIDRGDDLNARDESGLTPLMLAALRNKPGVCSLLLYSGADPSLVDPKGNNAISHAQQAGAAAALAAIRTAISLTIPAEHPCQAPDGAQEPAADSPTESITKMAVDQKRDWATASTSAIDAFVALVVQPLAITDILLNPSATASPLDADNEQPAAELSDWEPEADLQHGDDDPILATEAATVQIAISNHTPFDSSANWDDLDVYLPITSAPLRRTNDAEAKATLRLLLLRAVREGSVPDMAVIDAATNDDRSGNEASEALLRMVINDLGAETDERFEYSEGDESFEVITPSEESPEEDDVVSDAMAFIEAHESNRNDPLRCRRRFNIDHLCRLNFDQGLKLTS